MNVWFIEAIWVYFYRIFMNDAQIGILDATAFAVGLLAEIPSGALADRFGRARIVKLGIVLAAIGTAGQAFGDFSVIIIFQSITMIGFAFMSGADEALFFEKLRFKKEGVEWRKLITKGGQMAYMASIIGIPVGSMLYAVNHELVFVLNGLIMAASGIALLGIRDAPHRSANDNDLVVSSAFSQYVTDIVKGFRLFGNRNLRGYVAIILAIQGLAYIFDWGLLKLLLMDRFGFSEQFGGWMMSIGGILVVSVLFVMARQAQYLHEKRVMNAIALGLITALLASVWASGALAIGVILLFFIVDAVLYPFISEALNTHISNKGRATALSVASFLKSIPYVLLAPLIGWLNTIGRLDVFLIGWSVVVIVALVYYNTQKKNDTLLAAPFNH